MRKIPFAGVELTSNVSEGYEVPLSYRGDGEAVFWKFTLIVRILEVRIWTGWYFLLWFSVAESVET